MPRPLLAILPVGASCWTLLVCLTASAQGQVTFSLVPSTDLSQLAVNDTVTIQVNVSGITVGQELDFVAAIVTWDADRFGLPQVTPDSILPNNPADFLAFASSEIVDGAFLTFGTDPAEHIVANSNSFTFFSFELTALAAGTGSFQFGTFGATEFNPSEPTSPLPLNTTTADSLAFLILVPEPTSMVLLISTVGTLVVMLRHRRLRTHF